ncbi:response regulator [Sulfuriferula sp. AH1]|uniref:response regulator n=1 Tax=Sulfuriferula sp. AH1 TaxID=1985873 RepID=UPI000B3B2CBC|nr:response regulator [Sulfuriferula sp. AH1]ARU31463.1 response regulator [Sulfuriferula sp. AH1]
MGYINIFRTLLGKTAVEPSNPANEHKTTRHLPSHMQTERRNKKRLNARKGTRALIIDDSPTIIFALKKMLQSTGYVTFEASDAEQGMALARKERPDIIFLDIVLPGMNGFAALRMLRRDPLTQPIPIIMISSNEQATEQFFGSRIGAEDFMKKPFSRFEVFARIERLLDADLIPRRISVPASDSVPKNLNS